MITTHSQAAPYRVHFTNGHQQADADVLPHKGGQGAGFGPHELMEASFACCINMWIRMQADTLGLPVGSISVAADLEREHPNEARFHYTVELGGSLSPAQKTTLLEAADNCPVRRTLLKKLSFERRAAI